MREFILICTDCGKREKISARSRIALYEQARGAGWAISRGRTNCYCPNCAAAHRNVGKFGARVIAIETSIQEKIDL